MDASCLTGQLLQITLDRSKAFRSELERVAQRQYPPTGPKKLVDLTTSINSRIARDLSAALSGSRFPQSPDRRVEIFLRGKSSLLNFLHLLLQCLEGAEIQTSPGTFIVPIRSMLERHLGGRAAGEFDFIVRSSRAYNYMIWTVHGQLRRLLVEAGYGRLAAIIPPLFFVIECPISEKRNVPIHCVFAHEIGHAYYETSELPTILLPRVSRTRDPINTKIVISNWIEELCADAIALCLLGPAYVYAFIYFSGPFCAMSEASETHPPDNVRIELLCRMLLTKKSQGGLSFGNALESSNIDYLKQWQQYAETSLDVARLGAIYSRLSGRVRSSFSLLMKETSNLMAGRTYTPFKYKTDMPGLLDNIENGVPPNEIITDFVKGSCKTSGPESILNAGWDYLIKGNTGYHELLGKEDKWGTTNRLFDLVSKGLEYAEIKRRWSKT